MKLAPSLIAVAGMIATQFTLQIQAWTVGHPQTSLFIAGVAVIVANFFPQPHK